MTNQTFSGFHADAALQGLGDAIKSLARYSSLSDQQLARDYHLGTHTIMDV